MKPFPAIATLEFREIPAGMVATDAMVKRSPIALLRNGLISAGRYLTLIGGSTAAVEEAWQEGLRVGGEDLLDEVFLPDVHPQLWHALQGERRPAEGEAMGVLETETVSAVLAATETALKTADLTLMELRFADSLLAGRAVSLLHGVLHDVEAGLDAAVYRLTSNRSAVSHRIISAPHEALFRHVEGSTSFHEARGLQLDGEMG